MISSLSRSKLFTKAIVVCLLPLISFCDNLKAQCDCKDYIYLNETSNGGRVHKFEVPASGGSLVSTEVGSPWLDNAALGESLTNPHGLATDLNGFLYIGETSGGDVRRITCDGDIIPAANYEIDIEEGYNYGSIGNTLYVNTGWYDGRKDGIYAFDLCTGAITGFYCLNGLDLNMYEEWDDWGMYVDKATNKIYVTDGYSHLSANSTNGANDLWVIDVATDVLNPDHAANPVCIDPLISSGDGTINVGDKELPVVENSLWGVTTDNVGNIYIVESIATVHAGPFDSRILKYATDGSFITASPWDTVEGSTFPGINPATGLAYTSDDRGFYNAIGIVFSDVSNQLYVSTNSPIDDCVALFDTDLNYLGAAVPYTNNTSIAKGIAISSECCPTNNNITVDTTLCAASINDIIFLQELINCSGTICEGMWQEGLSNSGLTYNFCNNSVTIDDLNACGSFILESDGTGNNPQCEAFKITVNITVNSLNVTVTQTSCTDNNGTFTANYDAIINWNSEPCQAGEMINVTNNGSSIGMIDPSTDSSPSTIPFTVTADGNGTNNIKAEFTIAGCSDSTSFKSPLPCPTDIATCTSETGCLGGNAFEDFNCNGAEDTYEPGVQGVQVEVYDCNNNSVGTTYTDSDGDWQLCGLTDGDAYRIEFILPESIACWASPTHAGGGNETDVQFLTAPTCTKFSLSSPADYCEPIPRIAVSCFENGDPTGNTNPSLVSFNYSASGLPSNYQGGTGINGVAENPVNEATIADIGAVHGTGWQANQQRLFTAALLKRYVGLKDGPGYVYTIDFSTGSTAAPVGFNLDGINPANGGTAINLGTVCRDASCANDVGNTGFASDYELANSPLVPSIDLDAFAKVGTMAFGDADIAEDGNTLFLVNLFQRAITTVDVSGPTSSLPGTVNQYLLGDLNGVPSCTNGIFRPWALAFNKGRGYLGGVCDASISQDGADLQAYILSFDPDNINAGFTTEINFALDYNREIGQSGPSPTNTHWQPWVRNWAELNAFTNGSDNNLMAPQPIIGDIVFNERGDMTIGLIDRFGHQNGRANLSAESQSTQTWDTNSGGDLIQICNVSGAWVLEGGAGCSVNDNNITGNPLLQLLQNDGATNNGEFFYEDHFTEDSLDTSTFTHGETATGSLSLLKGSGEVISTHYDPLWGPPRIVNAQGVVFHDTYTGEKRDAYQIVESSSGDPNTFAKANGLGDLQLLCAAAPLEIGNYVWCDSIENGIQDACEKGIDDMIVQLYDASGILVGQDTTVNGNYYFNQFNVDTTGITVDNGNSMPNNSWSGMSYATKYYIVFGNTQYDNTSGAFNIESDSYSYTGITTTDVNSNNNDNIDSDVDENNLTTALGDMPANLPNICMTTNAIGCGNHRYDFGILCEIKVDSSDYLDACIMDPCHIIKSDIYLGTKVTADTSVIADALASGDTDEALNIFPSLDIVPGGVFQLPISMFNATGNTAYLNVWIDWNGDGDFVDANEAIVTPNTYNNTGAFNDIITVNVPASLSTSQIGLRFRFSTDNTVNANDPCGTGICAIDGEVEDYIISVDCKEEICLPVTVTIKK